MAFPTAVDSQITDSVTQANVKVLGNAATSAASTLYQATGQALGDAAHNATSAQQQAAVVMQAATTMGVATLYSLDTASTGKATSAILGAQPVAESITDDHIAGHLLSQLYSPQGKQAVQEAVVQANTVTPASASAEALAASQSEIETAIGEAVSAGVGKQSVCHILHQVAYDRGISLLYPFDTQGKTITADQIEAYYHAIIKANDTGH